MSCGCKGAGGAATGQRVGQSFGAPGAATGQIIQSAIARRLLDAGTIAAAWTSPERLEQVIGALRQIDTGLARAQNAQGLRREVRDVTDSIQARIQELRGGGAATGQIRVLGRAAQRGAWAPGGLGTLGGFAARAENPFFVPPTAAPAPTTATATVSCQSGSCLVRELAAIDDGTDQRTGTFRIPNGSVVEILGHATGVIRFSGLPVGPQRWAHVRVRAADGAVHEGWMFPENLSGGQGA